jgi:hypothetical protein
MSRPLFVAALPEEWMKYLCIDTVDGKPPFPTVDPEEVEHGDTVYVTVTLTKAAAQAGKVAGQANQAGQAGQAGSEGNKGKEADDLEYALPGTVKVDEGKKTVELFESGIWDREHLARVETVTVTEGMILRRGARPAEAEEANEHDDQTEISALWEDPTAEVAEVARNLAMRLSSAFGKYMIKEEGRHKNLDANKWELFSEIVTTMAEQMTVAEFREQHPAKTPTQEEAKQFKIDFIDPALAVLVAGCDSESDIKDYKERIGKLRSNAIMKYVFVILDIMVDGPIEEPEESKQPGKNVDVAKLQASMDAMLAQLTVLSAQVRLGGSGAGAPVAADKPDGEAKAKILKVDGDHSCAYHVMNAGGVKSLDADATLDLSPEARARSSRMTRKTVCLEANKVWQQDKTAFEALHGSYPTFLETITQEKPGSSSWPAFCQWVFYANGNPQLEFRIKQRVKEGKVQTYSTKKIGADQPAYVMFPLFRGNHYDIAAVEKGGVLAYVFPAAKADAAEKLIDAFLKGSKQVPFAKDLDQEELGQVLDGLLGLADDGQGEEPFTMVESRNNKKKRKKADGEKKAAAAAKKAAAKVEAEADARVAKAAVKAAADLFRQSAGAWAQPPPDRQDGGGWGHHHGGGSGLAAPPPPPPAQRARSADHTNRTPAVVVFGDGSKRSLRRTIKALDPAVDKAISAMYMVTAGAPRAVLYCKAEDLETLLSVLPLLKADGIGCAAYEERRGGGHGRKDPGEAPPKAKQADHGLRNASQQAGLCHYMSAGKECPHSLRGQCRFVCYEQQRSAQRRQPPGASPPAPRRQPPGGWRR